LYPILFAWGPIVIPSWHFMYAVGAMVAFVMLGKLNQRLAAPLTNRQISNLYIIGYICGYFGARFLSIVIEQPELHTISGVILGLTQLGPMTFYGGAISTFLGGVVYAKIARLKLPDILDIAMPCGLIALAIGRVGCFLNGDDYGSLVPETWASRSGHFMWAVVFPNLEDNLPRYPVQLWETLVAILIAVPVILNFNKIQSRLGSGMVGYFIIAGYANLRFVLEFFRGDFRGQPFGNWMSSSQLISIVILILCGLALPKLLRKSPAPKTQG
jgi:phosphatidylglycerol:prolipoprotein diacylglycerol transferase